MSDYSLTETLKIGSCLRKKNFIWSRMCQEGYQTNKVYKRHQGWSYDETLVTFIEGIGLKVFIRVRNYKI